MQACLFDAYGTLLDTVSPVRRHAARIGPDWAAFAALWRAKQLEYTWVRSLAGAAHVDFARVTEDALAFAAARHGLDRPVQAELRAALHFMEPFPDAVPTLERLRAGGLRLAVLSNGTPEQLARQLGHAGLTALFEAVISVEQAGTFKPDARVYRLASERLALPPDQIGFVSSNPWDAFGASLAGLAVFWVNRAGQPEEYGLATRARAVLADLSALPMQPTLSTP
jgi:2-haloacid dehalogenase